MYKAIGIALAVAGAALLIWGISASESFASDVSRLFTGEPTDRAMWLTIGGIAALVGGGTLAAMSGRRGMKA